ncbi:hypothetical protein Ae505Ps2_3382 [Pseudonocardia sp. Ae505_Ps2]|nr:hypothetical protein Ae505Ps2_3382 [Pseudonocardia sp. Ae505_Ps2]
MLRAALTTSGCRRPGRAGRVTRAHRGGPRPWELRHLMVGQGCSAMFP